MNDRHRTELRRDPLSGRNVIVAVQRSKRPHRVGSGSTAEADGYDPFAEGNEHDTPAETLSLRHVDSQPDGVGWLLRVVPNRFPAVTQANTSEHIGESNAVAAASGIHEVVIECPDRRTHLTELSVPEVTRILIAWQTRLNALSQRPDIDTVHIFRNEGAMAGASLPHCHSQIMATAGLETAEHRTPVENPSHAYQRWLNDELSDGDRVVSVDDDLVVVCPFASRVAWQVRLCPNTSRQQALIPFGQMNQVSLQHLAGKLLSVATSLRCILDHVSFNLLLKLPPVAQPNAFPWVLDLTPRTGQFAGFELLATNTDIVTTAPESAAAGIRDVWEAIQIPAEVESLWPSGYEWV